MNHGGLNGLITAHLIFSELAPEQRPLRKTHEMGALEKCGRMMKKRRGRGDAEHTCLAH